jgi:hypothetical protein
MSEVSRCVDLSLAVSWLPDEGMPEMPERHATKISAKSWKDESKDNSEAKVSKPRPL